MKKSTIENLSISEFKRELTQENYDYIIEEYPNVARALECYQEGAEQDPLHEDTYLDINEYFDLDRESYEVEEEYEDEE